VALENGLVDFWVPAHRHVHPVGEAASLLLTLHSSAISYWTLFPLHLFERIVCGQRMVPTILRLRGIYPPGHHLQVLLDGQCWDLFRSTSVACSPWRRDFNLNDREVVRSSP
jgi:hypothetical protein